MTTPVVIRFKIHFDNQYRLFSRIFKVGGTNWKKKKKSLNLLKPNPGIHSVSRWTADRLRAPAGIKRTVRGCEIFWKWTRNNFTAKFFPKWMSLSFFTSVKLHTGSNTHNSRLFDVWPRTEQEAVSPKYSWVQWVISRSVWFLDSSLYFNSVLCIIGCIWNKAKIHLESVTLVFVLQKVCDL